MSKTTTNRAIVTGMGVMSPIGVGRDAFAAGVLGAKSGIERIRAFDTTPFRTPFGGEVSEFNPRAELTEEERDTLDDRYLQMAVHTARMALKDAGLDWSPKKPPGSRAGVVVGTCNGGLLNAQRQYEFLAGHKEGSLDRKMNLLIRYHACGKALTHYLGINGPSWVVSTACSSSTCALGLALELISSGTVDVVLAGGADALCMATMAGFDSIKATSTGRTAPFSLPPGLNLGEGAAFWIVENEDHAARRQASGEAEILGYSFTSDAYHPTAPDPRGDGQWRTMATAVERAGATVDQLGCINLHGTGTEANDRTESKAVRKLVGETEIPVHSFKSQVGHCLGAAGILEATAGLLAMNSGVVPATINFGEPRPGCDLDYVPNEPRQLEYDRFLSCNYAFGGHNAGVVIGTHDQSRPPSPTGRNSGRMVLTGAGAITSLGLGPDVLLDRMRRGERGIVPVGERVTGQTSSRMGGLIPDFTARDVDRRLDFKSMNPVSRYATSAARLTLENAGIRVSPREGKDTGIINGIYVGASEEAYMFAVARSRGAEADIGSFSSIVPNATGGWVSNALVLKGYSCTVTMGADAGLFSLAFARLAVGSGSTTRVLCGGADELFSRYYMNYDELGLLQQGEHERDYQVQRDLEDRRVLAEGSAYVVAEERDRAMERNANILAELVGVGQTTEYTNFHEPNLDPNGLAKAVELALEQAGWDTDDVGLVCWSPQGNSRDLKTLRSLEHALGERGQLVPMITSVFHTGLAEASSGGITLCALLNAWSRGEILWPQITGLDEVDRRVLPEGPVRTILVATSELGFNLALALEPGEGVLA